jgi:hypothetical protein
MTTVAQATKQPRRHDAEQIKGALTLLHQPGDVFEIRVFPRRNGRTLFGYFNDAHTAARIIGLRPRDGYVWVSLNRCLPDVHHRAYNELVPADKGDPTSDKLILDRVWLLVDFDPARAVKGISSTDAEHEAAYLRALEAAFVLSTQYAWPEAVVCDSGNGFHLLYRIELPNDDAATALVTRLLKALAQMFNTGTIQIDPANSNSSRMTKLYGTLAAKGSDTPERPWRQSRIIEVPEEIVPLSRELMEAMAARFAEPKPEATAGKSKRKPKATDPQSADPEEAQLPEWAAEAAEFIRGHIESRGAATTYKEGVKFPVVCPWASAHTTGPENAVIVVYPTGARWFGCKHDHCADKKWADVWHKFEGGKKRERQPAAAAETEPQAEADSAPEAEPVEGAEIVKQVEETIRKYVVMPEAAYLALAIWTIATYAADRFDCFAYVAVLSPVKACGKTRLLEVLETLVHGPWRGTAPSPASLYRMMADAPTLLLDETEVFNVKNKSESAQAILSILNAGHRKGATIPRCDGPKNELRHFPVFGPKAFAAIGKLPDTLMDRSLILGMQRRTKNQKVARFLMARAKAEAKPIREGVAAFVRAYRPAIEEAYKRLVDADLDFLGDREADLWIPLFAVCSITDPDRLRELKQCAIDLSKAKSGEDANDSLPLKLLADIRTVWPEGQDKCSSADLLEKLKALEESPWTEHLLTAHKLARMLKPFGVKTEEMKLAGRVLRGYGYAALETAFACYLANESATSATSQ